MRATLFVFCLVAVGSTYSEPELNSASFFKYLIEANKVLLEDDKRLSVNINEYMDKAVVVINKWLVTKGMDPLRIDDMKDGFSVKVGLIRYHGELSLTHGWMQGLSTVIRSGDAFLNYEAQLLNARIPLAFESVLINYDYLAKIMNLGPKGGLEGKITNLQVFVDITIDTKTTEIVLQAFKITNTGKITVKFSGNPLVDWLSNALSGVATTILKNVITGIVQNEVRTLLEKTIDQINNSA